jgi:hypothetical protein
MIRVRSGNASCFALYARGTEEQVLLYLALSEEEREKARAAYFYPARESSRSWAARHPWAS